MKKVILGLGIVIVMVATTVALISKDNQNIENSKDKNSSNLSEIVKVGDYITYNAVSGNEYTSTKEKNGSKTVTFKTTGNEKWRVLSIEDNGTVNLISEKGLKSTENGAFEIKGGIGYANAIEELNAICNIYAKGNNAISARCMTYEDVIDIIGIDVIAEYFKEDLSSYETKQEKINKIYELLGKETLTNQAYGTEFEVTDSDCKYIPNVNNEDGYEQVESLKIKSSYIPITHIEAGLISDKDKMSLLTGTEDGIGCWIATNFEKKDGWYINASRNKYYVGYGLYYTASDVDIMRNNSINPTRICFSNKSNGNDQANFCIRPVVVLDKETKCNGGTGTSSDPFILD